MFFRQLEVGSHEVFAYLIGDPATGEALVVDPAADVDHLIAVAADAGLSIRWILNTHGHVDHVMGNAEMREKTGAAILIHEDDATYLPKMGEFWLRTFQARRSPPADRTLVHGELVQVGAHGWTVLHTPGHTPGSICLYHPGARLCLTGDTLFVDSVGRTDGPWASEDTMFASIRDRLLTLPDDTVICPGHHYGLEPTSTIQQQRISNPFLADIGPDGNW
ncbi:MAG: MBL fold metallo-hydrolase [Proteobacteria bacterium]|nr:MBL fold metallo-hydrolase [Pseudomonadota bacterium]